VTTDPDHRPNLPGMGHAGEKFEEGEEAPPRGAHAMAIVRWGLIGLMALAAVASVVYYFGGLHFSSAGESGTQYYCPMHPSIVQDHPGECPICSMTLVPREGGKGKSQPTPGMHKTSIASDAADAGGQQPDGGKHQGAYYCPMHPNETSDDPNARCPECGMKMEPRMQMPDAGQGMTTGSESTGPGAAGREGRIPAGLGPVDLTHDRIQLLGMRTAPVKREQLDPELRTVGYVAANEKGLAQIHTRFAGWIEQLNVNQTGERVRRGQVLASIYSPELLNAQQEFINARRWSSEGGDPKSVSQMTVSGLAADARRRLELLGISKTEIDRLAQSGQPLRALPVRSTVNGYVTAKNVQQGQYVDPSAVMFEVADLSTVWVLADVYEYQIDRISVGQRGILELVGLPGRTFTGQVQFIYPSIDAATRTLRVRFEFPNLDLKLRPGMYGNVQLELGKRIGLVIPAEGLVDTGEVQYVFLALGGGHFEPRRVRVGERSGEMVQILEGVDQGDVVVTTANFLIDSESRLRATIEGSTGGAPQLASDADEVIDKAKYPDKYQQYRACEVQHRGMGTMEEDCKNAIPKPWK
jgi:Cu(I)/Ag(I) efflux system membrane fusion protein